MKTFFAIFAFLIAVPMVGAQSKAEIVAATLILEAGGERAKGAMEAVKEVLDTRADKRGTDAAFEALRKKQFSCWNAITVERGVEIARNHARWREAYRIATDVRKTNYTFGADHYHAKYVTPYWAKSMTRTATVGNHIFYRSR